MAFIDYDIMMFCTVCRTRCTKDGAWRKNRCKECHMKLRTLSRDSHEAKRY